MQAKHADVCSVVLFWTACTRRTHVLSLPYRFEKSDWWRQAGSVKTAKKSHDWYHIVVMWHWIVKKRRRGKQMLSFHRTFFQFTRLHGVAVMQGLIFWNSVVTLLKSARWYVLSGTEFLVAHQLYIGNVMRECKLANQVPTSPVKTLVIRTSWSYRCFEWRSASMMLLESIKNKLKQWLVIEKMGE